ncbi:hypothetical protein AN958_12375 [Leucoagaricus sp. SymC.cos]|nr:hypothetical protein AN958_12375 [Leucoagaricus sp. SymC.cos]
MLIRGFQLVKFYGNNVNELVRVVFGDGIVYFFYVFALSVINIVVLTRLSASEQEPRYVIKNDNTGKETAYKPGNILGLAD